MGSYYQRVPSPGASLQPHIAAIALRADDLKPLPATQAHVGLPAYEQRGASLGRQRAASIPPLIRLSVRSAAMRRRAVVAGGRAAGRK